MDAVHAPFIVLQHYFEVIYLFHFLHQLCVQSSEYYSNVIVSNSFSVLCQLLQRLFIDNLCISETQHQICFVWSYVLIYQVVYLLDVWKIVQITYRTRKTIQNIRCPLKRLWCIIVYFDDSASELTYVFIMFTLLFFNNFSQSRWLSFSL